jgi:hypothetical protein
MLSALVRHGCELIGCELTHLVDLGRLNELQPLFDRGQVLGGVDIQTMLQLPNGRPAVEHAITHRYCSACDGALLGAVGQPVAYDLLELAFAHGFPRATALCEVAAQEGDLELLMFAHKQGCPLTVEVYKLAAEEGNLSCLQYLVGTCADGHCGDVRGPGGLLDVPLRPGLPGAGSGAAGAGSSGGGTGRRCRPTSIGLE